MISFSSIKPAHLINNGTVSRPGIYCLLITIIILIAGLWPFNFIPTNNVVWLQNVNGLTFNHPGIVYSKEPLMIQDASQRNAACSIELLIRPQGGKGYRSILTLFGRNQEQLTIGQVKNKFYIRIPRVNANIDTRRRYREIGINNVLEEDKTRLISAISRNGDTAIYIDGTLVRNFHDFSLMTNDQGLSGILILGNSLDGMHTWNGTFFGLAIYDIAMTDKEVFDHYHEWQTGMTSKIADKLTSLQAGEPAGRAARSPIALYLFDEHGGEWIRNHSSDRNHLLIPATFQPFHRTILGIPQREYWFTYSNAKDVIINILGFVPFGFFFAGWLRKKKKLPERRVLAVSLLLGFCLSMTIEFAQGYLPTRDSSLLDVTNNTLGTAAGFLLLKYLLPICSNVNDVRIIPP
jgi:VanZ family protein